MAETHSFDIVSQVNLQEVDNAVNQARKEIGQRYDFKGSKSSIELNQKDHTITMVSDDEFKMKSVIDVVQTKLIKRGVPIKALDFGHTEPSAGGTVRQIIKLRVGISKEDAKLLVQVIKDTKLRVQSQIMDDQVRVTGKNKDDLQKIIGMLREAELKFAIQFTNYR